MTSSTHACNPYPHKCHLPFLLYPPGMYRNPEGPAFLEKNMDLQTQGDEFVLYISIPFCRTRCKSCPYFISLLPYEDKQDREERFMNALIQDIIRWSQLKKWKTGIVREIYIGGGTGSILKTKNIQRLVDTIFSHFQIDPAYGFTLEGNARDFTPDKIEYIAHSPINRLSLGVQSFQPEILTIVGSPHAAAESVHVIEAFQKQNFHNIQIDLMYNMPHHTLDVWEKDLDILSKLHIPHFTIYLYRIHDATPQKRLIHKGIVDQPAQPETPMVRHMHTKALEMAQNMGYHMYMVDHFCKPGYENRYNHWNWRIYIDTLAIGPGSYSYFEGYRLGTEADIEKYITSVEKSEFLISTITDKLSERVQKERYVIFALLYFEIIFDLFAQRFKTDFLTEFRSEVARLHQKKLIEIKEDRILLTPLGREWHMNVILEFFNPKFWENTEALKEPNWSLNGIMVEVGAKKRDYWLGSESVASHPT